MAVAKAPGLAALCEGLWGQAGNRRCPTPTSRPRNPPGWTAAPVSKRVSRTKRAEGVPPSVESSPSAPCGDQTEPPTPWIRGNVERLRSHLIWVGRLSVVVSIVERLVPDELWELFQRVVPEAPSRPQGGGRRRHGDREVLAAIVFVATSGCTWQQLPSASFGPSGATAHRRFAEWSKARVWAKLHRLVLDELGARGELDWSRCAIDSVNMRALKRGT